MNKLIVKIDLCYTICMNIWTFLVEMDLHHKSWDKDKCKDICRLQNLAYNTELDELNELLQ